MEKVLQSNNREFFRLQLQNALSSDMRIIKIQNNVIETANKEVLIDEIGPGGLRFLTDLKLPVNPSVIWGFKTEILDQIIDISGIIIRSREIETGIYEYGLKFTMDEKERISLIRICNELALKLKRSPIIKGCRFISINKINFFKQNRS